MAKRGLQLGLNRGWGRSTQPEHCHEPLCVRPCGGRALTGLRSLQYNLWLQGGTRIRVCKLQPCEQRSLHLRSSKKESNLLFRALKKKQPNQDLQIRGPAVPEITRGRHPTSL
ncbi:hypothetical protein NDU88_002360 [Pleurodeles waltl]|uniref:Uncharacterized protein n=1 Tax=Pleurodeles waltl TaxID=8319 RepID=A0AAV7KTY9_PLEWA|nr:hypothetical protein NDU88_002360 [Pleurodeles waltl]